MSNSQQTIKDNSAARVSAKPQHNIRVVKIGGSLLDLPDLSTRLSSWLNRQVPMPTVWIVGGGIAVDALRENICESLADQESMHWAAINIMSSNVKSVWQFQFPDWILVNELEVLKRALLETSRKQSPQASNILFDCSHWLQSNSYLPRTWDVTSDSIAVALAGAIKACEVVLLKSVEVDQGKTIASLVDSGIVDAYFETALENLRKKANGQRRLDIRFENARAF